MKYVLINSWCKKGSTGRIVLNFYDYLCSLGHEVFFFHGRDMDQPNDTIVRITNHYGNIIHGVKSRLSGLQGFYSKSETAALIKQIDKIKPDYVYLFNLHGYYLNEPMLLSYLKESGVKVVYMLFDEYPYLGKCCFSGTCNKFKTECRKCPQVHEYPNSLFFDKSNRIFNMKKDLYSGWVNLHFAGVPFVKERASESALAHGIPYCTFNMGVDIENIYYPKDITNISRKLKIDPAKKIVLTVGFSSDPRKGIDKYIKIARMFDDNTVFLHIGYDKKITKSLPSNYYAVEYVSNLEEMSEIYSLADVYLTTSSGEAMSNACLEALACGTPIIAFDVSGMSYLADAPIGKYAKFDDLNEIKELIKSSSKKTDEIKKKCRSLAEEKYSLKMFMNNMYKASVMFDEVIK